MVEQTWGGHLSMELPYLVYKVVQFQYQFLSINVSKTQSFLKQPSDFTRLDNTPKY